ncbi:uncharacterized protein BDV14DRAFT_171987 [Aspergillus stella-maris]|uniref:uncharacterized protein n=1 Tax=Aspergillus stella-maris TaxID=1810926 RepID=UPI003CCD9B1C
MGLAVAKALSQRPSSNWEVHILDIDQRRGSQGASSLQNTTFHYADVTKYDVLSEAFHNAFSAHNRLDFVFANAGMIERFNFYEAHPNTTTAELGDRDMAPPPPEPDLLSIDADLKGVILTSYLAQHYFRASVPSPGLDQGAGASQSLVMTASCGGLYPSFYSPLYSAAKFGVVGFMRSIANHFLASNIRANAICPGIVRTSLVDQKGWAAFPQHRFVEMESVVRVVLQLAGVSEDQSEPEGAGPESDKKASSARSGLTDSHGTHLPTARLFGQAVEISDGGVYFRQQHEFCDEGMREVMAATVVENQVGAIIS